MPRRGTSVSMSGVSWFGVDLTASPVPSQTSHVQPEPNRLTPASFTCFFSSSALPNTSEIASASAPTGSPPPSGDMISQNSEWFACPPPLLRTAVRLSSGMASRFASTDSIGWSIHSVPSSAAFRFVTYAAWCLSWWISIVFASMCGSSASKGYERSGTLYAMPAPLLRGDSGRRICSPAFPPCPWRKPDEQLRRDPAPRPQACAPRARRHLPDEHRGALPPVSGLRGEAERDPRAPGRHGPEHREPGVLRRPLAEGRPDL